MRLLMCFVIRSNWAHDTFYEGQGFITVKELTEAEIAWAQVRMRDEVFKATLKDQDPNKWGQLHLYSVLPLES
jgi:hypothetical protein